MTDKRRSTKRWVKIRKQIRAILKISLWPLLVIATMNMGKTTPGKVLVALDEIAAKAGRRPDVIFGQEMSDRSDIKRALREIGYEIVEGTGQVGQGATPVFLDKETLDALPGWVVRLLGRVFGGRGAGPSWIKPKWINGARATHTKSGRRIRATSVHMPASMQFWLRFKWGRVMAHGLVSAFRYLSLQFMGGDYNSKRKQLAWFRRLFTRAGWTSSDIASGHPLNTHGHNNYDQIWWIIDPRIIFVKQFTIDFGSDHLCKVAVFRIMPTLAKAREIMRAAA